MISIVIPNLNKGHFIAETLRSVAKQTSSNWEALIVDDGSKDDSMDVISSFCAGDNRFRGLTTREGQRGGNRARNIGLSIAKGSHVIFLDSDDILPPQCVENRSSINNLNIPKTDIYVASGSVTLAKQAGGLVIAFDRLHLNNHSHLTALLCWSDSP